MDTQVGKGRKKAMGNTSSASWSSAPWSSVSEIDGNDVDYENVIVNIGVLEKCGFDAINILNISLATNGDQIAQTKTAAYSTQLQQGLTYSLHKSQMDSAVITIQVMNGEEVVAKQSIFVKSLLGAAATQKMFFHDVTWDQSTTASDYARPTVKLGFQLLSGDGKIHMGKQPHFQV